jgi:hypothetical protein
MSNYDRKVFSAYNTRNSMFYSFILIIIIAIPISITLYLTLQVPITFSALMFSTLIGRLILLSYLAASSKNNKYETTNTSITIKFGPLQKSFNYNQIIKAEIIKLKLILRIFRASLPGFHWGLFKTNIGSAHIYATRIKGQFILLTLNDGEKIALSPEKPEEFLNTIEERKNLFKTQPTSLIKQKEQTTRTIIQVLAVTTAYIIFLAYFTWVYIQLPINRPITFWLQWSTKPIRRQDRIVMGSRNSSGTSHNKHNLNPKVWKKRKRLDNIIGNNIYYSTRCIRLRHIHHFLANLKKQKLWKFSS